MVNTQELGLITFNSCEELFQQLPKFCESDGGCDPHITAEITADDLVGLQPELEGVRGEAALEIYASGNSFSVELRTEDEGLISMFLYDTGMFLRSEMPGKNSPDRAEFEAWLEADAPDPEEDDEPEYTELSPEMAAALATLAGRLVSKVLEQ